MSFENQQLDSDINSQQEAPSVTEQQQQPQQQNASVSDLSSNQQPQVIPQVAQLADQDFLVNLPVPNPPTATSQTSSSPPKTLWMGDLDPWSDEESIINLWLSLGKRVLVKLIKAKKGTPAATLNTGHAGYCFIEFETYDDAKSALSLNGSQIPNTSRTFRLNWASGATLSSQIVQSPEYSLFVGDLSPSTTEAHLLALFQTRFKSVKTVRVMTDPTTGTSRCFGFVRFSDEDERTTALNEMSGVWCAGRPLRVALATSRNAANANNQMINSLGLGNAPPPSAYVGIPPPLSSGNNNQFGNPGASGALDQYQQPPQGSSNNDMYMYQHQQIPPPPLQFYHPDQQAPPIPPTGQFISGSIPHLVNPDGTPATGSNSSGNLNSSRLPPPNGPLMQSVPYSDPNNTTVFVGGLAPGVPEQTLAELFQPFGNIFNVKIPPGKGCGFIKFEKREDAEAAIAAMQGFPIGGSRVRLSWGRQQNNQRYQMTSLSVGGLNSNQQLNPNLPGSYGGNINDVGRLNDDFASMQVRDIGYDHQQQQQAYGVPPPVNSVYYLPNDRGFDYEGGAQQYENQQPRSEHQGSEHHQDEQSFTGEGRVSKTNTPDHNDVSRSTS
jgi:RNA recognition motif-containing protein